MPHVFSVREITRAIRDVLEGEFPFVWVRGQVGGVTRPGSGHLYFSLKDEDSLLNVVWFRSNQWQEKGAAAASLSEGMEVICAGRLAVYPPRGTYQLQAEFVQEEGLGRLFLEFEALKKKLTAKGWFDPSRKRSLPVHPARVGLITAPTGAAVRDFLRLARERGHGAQIRIYPSLVQGEGAVSNLVFALEQANLEAWAEVLVLLRGGGSLEDLWAFNTEPVAAAVVGSAIPVVTAIGHEVDTTIADMVADLRAATPSHAAQLLWTERSRLAQDLDLLEDRLVTARAAQVAGMGRMLGELGRALGWLSPARRLDRMGERLQAAAARLSRISGTLTQGPGDRLHDLGRRLVRSSPKTGWTMAERDVLGLLRRLEAGLRSRLSEAEHRLDAIDSGLARLDPDLPLSRGYSLVRVCRDGRILTAPEQVRDGDELDITLRQGRVWARVLGTGKQTEP